MKYKAIYGLDHIMQLLTELIFARGSIKAAAIVLNISEQYLWDVIHKRRKPGKKILSQLGYVKIDAYMKTEEVRE